jgi:hypothetical protein
MQRNRMPTVRDQRRAVGALLADRAVLVLLALGASGVTTSADRCITLSGIISCSAQR